MTGRRLKHYQIEGRLGSGGMGEVYKARDTKLDRLVAVKVLNAECLTNASRRQRFQQEARAASALNHPHIVTIHEIDREEEVDFMVMEYIAAHTLDALIPRTGMPLNGGEWSNSQAAPAGISGTDRSDWARVNSMTEEDIARAIASDPDTVTIDDWTDAELVMPVQKRPIHIRVDADLLEYVRGAGRGYLTRMNSVPRTYAQAQQRKRFPVPRPPQ